MATIINFSDFVKKRNNTTEHEKKQLPSDIKWYYIGKLDEVLKDQIFILYFFDKDTIPYQKYFQGRNDDILGVRGHTMDKLMRDTGAELITSKHRLHKYVTASNMK